MSNSLQKWVGRNRPPRVQITYDVEIGDAIQMKELPLSWRLLADLSGKPVEALPKLKDRKFVEIDRDNFNEVLGLSPRLALRCSTTPAKDDTNLNVELKFAQIDDFNPAAVVKQVEPRNKLLEARQRLTRPAGQARRQRQARRPAPGDRRQPRQPERP